MTDDQTQLEITCVSDHLSVRTALADLLGGLDALSLDVEESGTVELVIAEVLNNIVEHAYPDDSNGKIEINCAAKQDGLHFQITDAGRPMPDGQTPLGMPARTDVDFADLPEGGFGWFLIKDLAKDVSYQRDQDRNHLRLRLAVHTA